MEGAATWKVRSRNGVYLNAVQIFQGPALLVKTMK
jgi:hypothetical protein